jgi:hypothetical protein
MSKKTALEIAKEVGITLKNLKTFEGHDAGLGINADICLNGFPFAHAYDDAHGGMMDIQPLGGLNKVGDSYEVSPLLKRTRQMIVDVEAAIAKYPQHEVEFGGRSHMVKEDLEGIVNALVDEMETQKQIKREQKKGILVKTAMGYRTIGWKAGTIDNMFKKYPGDLNKKKILDMVQKAYDECKAKGDEVLNLEYLKSIGIKI